MANVEVVKEKDTKITLADGIERTLKYDLNALAELEDRYGSVDAAFDAMDNDSIKAIRCVLWAGLIHEDENLTEKQVGSLIDMAFLRDMVGTLGNALASDMPSPDPTLPQITKEADTQVPKQMAVVK